MTSNIKLLESNYQYCVFNTDNFNLFEINQLSFNVISHYLEHNDITETCRKFGISKDDVTDILKIIDFKPWEDTKILPPCINSTKKINRITLHVSNDCNLRCKYCYASGGSYGLTRKFMNHQTAERFIDYSCEEFNKIGNIVFFGGEPFLNPNIIEYICNNFNKRFANGEINFLPQFGAITNGTVLSDKVFSIIEKYFSFITISIDGPKIVNDINRVTANGQGTFDHIHKFIKRVSDIPNIKIIIEATYTTQHMELGYTREMIKDFFKEEYNLNADIVDEISLDNRDAAIKSLENPLESPWFNSLLNTIVGKRHETKCSILRKIFAISTDGYIYPCHMNVGDGMAPVSSIWESHDCLDKLISKDNSPYNLKNNPTCIQCWANNICGGCSRTTFYDSTKMTYKNTPVKTHCDDFKLIAEKTLLKICEVRKNPELWNALLNRAKTISNKSKINN